MKVFAHRGCSGTRPENTFVSFKQAATTGCYGIELDVQLTKDGKMVILHDEKIDRTSDGTGFVRDYTYEELLKFDFSAEFVGQFGRNTIPLMEEYLDWVSGTDLVTNIELKNSVCYYEGMAAQGSMAFRGTSLCKKQETNTLLLFDHWATNRILSLTDTRRAKSRRREVLSVQSHSRCMQTLSENAACIGRPEGKSPSVRSVQNPTVLWYADFSRYISSSAFLRSSDGLNSMSLTETA